MCAGKAFSTVGKEAVWIRAQGSCWLPKLCRPYLFFLLMSNAASQFCSPWTLPCRILGSIDTINNFFLNSTKLFLSSGEKNPKLPCVRAGVSSLSHFPCCNDYERGGQATGLATSVLASLVFCAPPIACCEPASATFYL